MSQQHHFSTDTFGEGGNPISEATGEASRHAAEIAAAAIAAMQMHVRIREQREQARQADDHQRSEQAKGALRAELAAARLAWAPALEPEFARTATSHEAMGAWVAAQPWVDGYEAAADAARRAEARLSDLHPDLMVRYEAHAAQGREPVEAMVEAGHDLARDLYDPFLPPIPFRLGIDPRLYALRNDLGIEETLRAWDAARVWAPRDERAAEAMGRAEQQLRRLRPEAMAAYDDARQLGAEPAEAMRAALPQLREHVWQNEIRVTPGLDAGVAAANLAVADQQRAAAHDDFSQPDVASTPGVDEHLTGAAHGANHQELADGHAARAEGLVAQAYPQTIHVALAARPASAAVHVQQAKLGAGATPRRGR